MAVSGTTTGSSREIYYLKGSIDSILDKCRSYFVAEDSTPTLDTNTRNVIMNKARSTAARGLRVIATAYGYGSVADYEAEGNSNLVFAGFQAMYDPPRKGVADSIALLQSGGVQVVMITGDSEQTALYIARQLGLRVGNDHETGSIDGSSYCLTGQAIDRLSKAQLKERVGTVSVFARTTPRHKMAIVEAFQSRGAIVAMTGDGGTRIMSGITRSLTSWIVNDAPALKMADIGVSMGKSGTDVAKEAADVILVDDNFSTILPAVEEGVWIFCAAISFWTVDRKINFPQYPKLLIFPTQYCSCSLDIDYVEHNVRAQQSSERHANLVY
jgi:Ca2+-transporting ATPase